MYYHPFQKVTAVLATIAALLIAPFALVQTASASITITNAGEKDIFLPDDIDQVPRGNDFNNPDSEYSFKHSKTTPNFILFWDKEYGDDPMTNSIVNRRFDVDGILKEADRFYDYYVNIMKWVNKDTSYATKHKFIFIVFPSPATGTGTAFGGAVDDGKIGAFWTPATRISRGPYGVVAHELGHSFQAMSRADGAASFTGGGGIAEMTSQWMLWQVYPEWMTFENYHLVAFMKATHLAFLHEDNIYHSPYVLEYWSEKHGVEFIGKMWAQVHRGEDPVMTYKRLTGINQDQFNDEIFDASRHFVTWDLPRIRAVAARYANQHTASLTKGPEDGWYQIATNFCIQNYGYNAIKLDVPAANTKVSIDFKGILDAPGYHVVRPELAGWRYGFLAYKNDGTRVYGDAWSKSPGTGEFTVPADTQYLWLVVSGAPTEHWIHVSAPRGGNRGRGRGRANTNTNTATAGNTATNMNRAATPSPTSNANEQWPYAFKLTGTTPDDSIVH